MYFSAASFDYIFVSILFARTAIHSNTVYIVIASSSPQNTLARWELEEKEHLHGTKTERPAGRPVLAVVGKGGQCV